MKKRLPLALSSFAMCVFTAFSPALEAQELNPLEKGLKARDAGNYQNAIQDFSEAIRLNLSTDVAVFRRAYCYYVLHDYARALADYNTYAKIKPTSPSPWTSRGGILQETGNLIGAKTAFRKAILLAPNDADIHNDLAWLLAASPTADSRNGAEAVTEARKACELAPANPAYMDTLAAAYAEQRRFDEAVAQQQAALEKARHDKSKQRDLSLYRHHLDLYQHHQPCHDLKSL